MVLNLLNLYFYLEFAYILFHSINNYFSISLLGTFFFLCLFLVLSKNVLIFIHRFECLIKFQCGKRISSLYGLLNVNVSPVAVFILRKQTPFYGISNWITQSLALRLQTMNLDWKLSWIFLSIRSNISLKLFFSFFQFPQWFGFKINWLALMKASGWRWNATRKRFPNRLITGRKIKEILLLKVIFKKNVWIALSGFLMRQALFLFFFH